MPSFKDFKTFLYSWGVLTNTIIGIGIFSLPFVSVKVGLPMALSYLALMFAVVTIAHLMLGEVARKTPDYKRSIGFAGYHLGPFARKITIFITFAGFLGSLLAYIIVGGKFLYQFCYPLIGGTEMVYSAAYFVLGAIIIYWGIGFVSRFEFWGLLLFFAIMAILALLGAPYVNYGNLAAKAGTVRDIFFPFGPMMFAFWASSSIPEVEEMLGRARQKKMFDIVILASMFTAWLTYAFFVVMIIGISGAGTAESALVGLSDLIGGGAASLLFFFGFITSFTSFVISGLSLKKILTYDMKVNRNVAWAAATFLPFMLFLSGLRDFILIFSLIGGVFLAVDGIMIMLMYGKVNPRRKFATYPLLLLFAGGIIYEIAYYLK